LPRGVESFTYAPLKAVIARFGLFGTDPNRVSRVSRVRIHPWLTGAAGCGAFVVMRESLAAPCYPPDAMKPGDLDPLGMGLVPDLRCAECHRDRHSEYMNADDVVVEMDGVHREITGVPCSCGATRIELRWLGGTDDPDIF
jgi:hypothetical protein